MTPHRGPRAAQTAITGSEAGRIGNVRWVMIGITFLIAAVAYLDRSNISIAAPVIKGEFALSDVQLGFVFSAFVLGYALTQPVAGWLADRFGAYKIIAIGIGWWSVLTALTAMIRSDAVNALAILLGARFLLGIGESIIFPASNRLVVNWIPSKERGLANGLIFSGVGIGAGLAPPLITYFMLAYDWRAAFWATAFIGVAALATWLLVVRDRPDGHRWVSPAELEHIRRSGEAAGDSTARAAAAATPWRGIFANRSIGFLTLSYFCFGYVAYIYFSWFFTYLATVRGLDLKSSGLYGMFPFIAMAIASPFGGWVSDRLATRFGARAGRCYIAAVGMGLSGIFIALATYVADVRLAAIVLAAGSGSLYLAQSAFWTLSADIGRRSAGTVAGLMNMGGQIGGVIVGVLTPVLAQSFGWAASFLFTAAVCIVGAIAWLFIDPETQLESM
jgi:ACS family glucarate transporter-like MFS transporter